MAVHTQATEESRRFSIETVRRAHHYAEEFTTRVYGDAPRPMQGEALLRLLRANMWREYVLGCEGPARLIGLISHEFIHLKHNLASQIVDEMRHSAIFSRRVSELGGDGELTSYVPTDEDWGLVRATIDFDHPAELVTSLNCTGEVILQKTLKRLAERRIGSPGIVDDETAEILEEQIIDDDSGEELLPPVVDEVTAEEMRRNIIPDEGKHIKFGRLVLQEFATTEEIRVRCRDVQDRKFAALRASHGRTVADATRLAEST